MINPDTGPYFQVTPGLLLQPLQRLSLDASLPIIGDSFDKLQVPLVVGAAWAFGHVDLRGQFRWEDIYDSHIPLPPRAVRSFGLYLIYRP